MKNKKVLSTSLSLGLSLALLIGNVSGNMNNVKAKEQGEKKQIYMIQASSEEKLDEVEHKYSIAETSAVENTDSVSTIYLTTQEAKELNEKEKNLVVEKDKVMHGFGKKTNFDLTDEQWNLKMIHANEETETVVKDKIKVAIIDSGIDYLHPAFHRGMTSKILSIWDQELDGGMTEKIPFGREFTRVEIEFLFYMKMEAVMERVLPELLLQKIIR